jgi:hypothetical protein
MNGEAVPVELYNIKKEPAETKNPWNTGVYDRDALQQALGRA